MPTVAAAILVGGNVYALWKKQYEVYCEDEAHQIISEAANEEVANISECMSFHEAVLQSDKLLQRVKV